MERNKGWRWRTGEIGLKEYYKLSEKAKNTKVNKPNTFLKLNKIFITSVLLCSV